MGDDNTVFIGKKATMNYVLAVVTQFNSGNDEVIIKARGRSISRAVDVAEIVRHRFVQDTEVKDIKIDTEVLQREAEGTSANVSSIEIFLKKT
jgi:DNA-binding protein